ncbi:MAG: helix-turn-helix transcriptional regulator [Propylenella sp.]
MALRLERAIGGNADHWLRMQAAYDLARARDLVDNLPSRRLKPKAA